MEKVRKIDTVQLLAELDKVCLELIISKTNNAYKKLRLAFSNLDTTVHTITTYGSGQWTHYRDCAPSAERILNKMGIEYEKGNDAPKGGAYGKYISIFY